MATREYAFIEPHGGLCFEFGQELPSVTVAYESWGRLNVARDNAVLLLHALTGDSHAGRAHPRNDEIPGWWDRLIGPGRALDPNKSFIVCPNVLGGCKGTTGPSSLAEDGEPFGSRFPIVTVKDQVLVEHLFSAALGIQRWSAVIGCSTGGMRAWQWCLDYPDSVGRAVIVAAPPICSAQDIDYWSTQVQAIRDDPFFASGDYYATGAVPDIGLAMARRICNLLCRSDMENRFGRTLVDSKDQGSRLYAVEDYSLRQAAKLLARFNANSYIAQCLAVIHHDLGRYGGDLTDTLGKLEPDIRMLAIDSDRLYPLSDLNSFASATPRAKIEVVTTSVGHDGCILAQNELGAPLTRSLLN